MKRNIDIILLDYDNKPIKDGAPKYKRNEAGEPVYDTVTGDPVILEHRDLTLKAVCFNALRAQIPGDESMTGEDKVKFYALGHKLSAGGVVDLTTDELALLKNRIGRAYDFITFGRSSEVLDTDYVEPPTQTA